MSEENKQRPSFIFFASHSIKNGAKSLIINVLIKMYLVKIKDQLVLIKQKLAEQCYLKKIQMVRKVHLNISLDIKLMLFQYNYA